MIQDPAQVKACVLSLKYWGGVVVYVNGKEVARGNMSNITTNGVTLAEDYPAEPLRPIMIRAARNTVFSGRLMVDSDQPIKSTGILVSFPGRTPTLTLRREATIAFSVMLASSASGP